MRAGLTSALALLGLAACESAPPPEPVIVYAPEGGIMSAEDLADFSDSTGIHVTVIYGPSDHNTNLVMSDSGSPPVDVLLTDNVADLWRAAEEGALRPLQVENLTNVPENLRDPNGMWVATEVRLAVVAVNREIGNPEFTSLDYLAREELRGEVCLVSSETSFSRSLIALMIADIGEKPAERLVRAWIRNLAVPPFESEEELLAAVRSGACAYGILSDSTTDGSTFVTAPEPAYLDISGAGVARHSRHPDSAHRFVDWIIEDSSLASGGVGSINIGVAGWRDEDARLVAERAGYR